MAQSNRTRVCKRDVVERMRVERGYSLERLAAEAKVTKKTIERMKQGRPLYLKTIAKIARALGTTPEYLIGIMDPARGPTASRMSFYLRLSIGGAFQSASQAASILSLDSEIIESLRERGITVTYRKSTIFLNDSDGFARRVVKFYAYDSDDFRRRSFVAGLATIRPSMFDTFQNDINCNTIDLANFSKYGEFHPYDTPTVMDRRTITDVLTGRALVIPNADKYIKFESLPALVELLPSSDDWTDVLANARELMQFRMNFRGCPKNCNCVTVCEESQSPMD